MAPKFTLAPNVPLSGEFGYRISAAAPGVEQLGPSPYAPYVQERLYDRVTVALFPLAVASGQRDHDPSDHIYDVVDVEGGRLRATDVEILVFAITSDPGLYRWPIYHDGRFLRSPEAGAIAAGERSAIEAAATERDAAWQGRLRKERADLGSPYVISRTGRGDRFWRVAFDDGRPAISFSAEGESSARRYVQTILASATA